MCLILFAWKNHPDYQLILAANRDEFYERPTAPASHWKDNPKIIAGRDLQAGGTWIGTTTTGRLAAITNYRDPNNVDPNAKSRGDLTKDFLNGNSTPLDYLNKVKDESHLYNGFNLMVGDNDTMMVYNNVNHELKNLEPGTYGLSNGFFQENWPKLKKGRDRLNSFVKDGNLDNEILLGLLGDTERASDDLLPKTGIPLDWERALSPLFIETEQYGTRCSTLIFKKMDGQGKFIEKTYPVGGQRESTLEFQI